MNMHSENWIPGALAQLETSGRQRRLMAPPDRPMVNFAGNDYLNLAGDPALYNAARDAAARWGVGAASSRLLAGSLPVHTVLEQRLAALKGYPAALLFGSGYMANLGIITALAGRGDWIIADRLAHASIIDAAILSRAVLQRFRHNDPEHLAALLRRRPPGRRCLIVTESVFSMDGDRAPLPELADLAVSHDAMLMVDEAHATGIFGPAGAGLVRAHGLEKSVNASMGTLSKALGGYGGFCACSPALRDWLVNRARALIFSTAPPPPVMGAALAALDHLARHPDAGTELLRRADGFRDRLRAAGLNTGASTTQIIPLIIGDNAAALALSDELRRHGILAPAIRPPTVPQGSARLRFSVTLAHSREQLERTAELVSILAQDIRRKISRPALPGDQSQ